MLAFFVFGVGLRRGYVSGQSAANPRLEGYSMPRSLGRTVGLSSSLKLAIPNTD